MKTNRLGYIKKTFLPCAGFSVITGAATGVVIFLFKVCSGLAAKASSYLYDLARNNLRLLPLFILGAAALGGVSAVILKHNKNSRGGGIPTSVAILRGLIDFHWLKNLFGLFFSALVTFLGGIPLGTEGPSVQMGTAIGRGTVELFGKKKKAWDRYIMTGGACGGFATATGAPLSGIIFAFEEAHRRFSPLIFMTAALSVSVSTTVMRLLCSLTGVSPYLFDFSFPAVLPIRCLWLAVLIGIACGISAIVFTCVYRSIGILINQKLKKIPFAVKTVAVFVLVAVLSLVNKNFTGSGHELIYDLVKGKGLWYAIVIYLCVRALILMLANHNGISGGIFVPTLAFGALIGALISKLCMAFGVLSEEYFVIPVIIGMAAFLSATSRTPITGIAFSLEALGGLSNTLPITVAVMLSFLIIEICAVPSLQDTVITQKVERFNRGKTSTVVDAFVTVKADSFVEGKELRNILWPATCTVLSVKKRDDKIGEAEIIKSGDILHIHYQTYDTEKSQVLIESIVGNQTENGKNKVHTVNSNNHLVPDI